MASDFAIWDADNGRYAILTMHNGKCWDVTIEDVEEGTELMRYGALGETAFDVAQSAIAYLPKGTTLDNGVQNYETVRTGTNLHEVILKIDEPEAQASVYGRGM